MDAKKVGAAEQENLETKACSRNLSKGINARAAKEKHGEMAEKHGNRHTCEMTDCHRTKNKTDGIYKEA